jgi:hypothetical protein
VTERFCCVFVSEHQESKRDCIIIDDSFKKKTMTMTSNAVGSLFMMQNPVSHRNHMSYRKLWHCAVMALAQPAGSRGGSKGLCEVSVFGSK